MEPEQPLERLVESQLRNRLAEMRNADIARYT